MSTLDAGDVLRVLVLAAPSAVVLRLLLLPPPLVPAGARPPAVLRRPPASGPADGPDDVVVLLGDGPGLPAAAALVARHLPGARAVAGPTSSGVRAAAVAARSPRVRLRAVAAALDAGLPVLVQGPPRRPDG